MTKLKSKIFALCLIVALPACNQIPVPESPAQAVYQLQGTYAAALSAEVTYSRLPKCPAEIEGPSVLRCSKPDVVRKVRTASDIAWDSIKAAQTAVRTYGFGSDISTTAYASAVSALKAYTDITTTLEASHE